MGIALNLHIALGSMEILTILILLLHEHVISFHLFVLSSISFISVLYFSEFFTSLIKCIPRYLILFDAIVNGIFLIFLPGRTLLICRIATDFCILFLYPATLINLLILIVFW